jgi:hypothetical protein
MLLIYVPYYIIEDISSMRDVVCIRRCVRACRRLLEAAKALATRDHVRGISGLYTLFNTIHYNYIINVEEDEDLLIDYAI